MVYEAQAEFPRCQAYQSRRPFHNVLCTEKWFWSPDAVKCFSEILTTLSNHGDCDTVTVLPANTALAASSDSRSDTSSKSVSPNSSASCGSAECAALSESEQERREIAEEERLLAAEEELWDEWFDRPPSAKELADLWRWVGATTDANSETTYRRPVLRDQLKP